MIGLNLGHQFVTLLLLASLTSPTEAQVGAPDYNQNCAIASESISTGFKATFYDYPLLSYDFQTQYGYLNYGYKNNTIQGTASGVMDPTFKFDNTTGRQIVYGSIYGQNVTVSNFVVELVGYLKAPESGTYQLEAWADDQVVVYFGNEAAFDCCDTKSIYHGNEAEYLNAYYCGPVKGVSIDLIGGQYYPIRIVMVNWNSVSSLTFTLHTPSGTSFTTDWSSLIYQFEDTADGGVCYSTITTPWTGSYTATTTIADPSTSGGSIVVVETPYGTTTVPWTGTYTTTTTSGGSIAVVETPYSTITVPWTGTYTATTTVADPSSSGGSIVVVETPTAPFPTTTVPWTGSFTTTETVADPNSSGGSIVVVETPYSTITVPWTGTFTTTETVADPSSSGGSIVVVETPTTPFPTTTVPWTGSFTTTETVADPNSSGGSIVVVETPYGTTTVPWTGTFTNTKTVEDPSSSGGSIVVVETPYGTTTVPWTGTFTNTKTVEDPSSSGGSIVVVETPTTQKGYFNSTAATNEWPETFTSTYTTISSSTKIVVVTPLSDQPSSIQSPSSSNPTTTPVTETDSTSVPDTEPNVPTISPTTPQGFGPITKSETVTSTDSDNNHITTISTSITAANPVSSDISTSAIISVFDGAASVKSLSMGLVMFLIGSVLC